MDPLQQLLMNRAAVQTRNTNGFMPGIAEEAVQPVSPTQGLTGGMGGMNVDPGMLGAKAMIPDAGMTKDLSAPSQGSAGAMGQGATKAPTRGLVSALMSPSRQSTKAY